MIRRLLEKVSNGFYVDRSRADKFHQAMDAAVCGAFLQSWPLLSENLRSEIVRQIRVGLPIYHDCAYLRLTNLEMVAEFNRTVARRLMLAYGDKKSAARLMTSELGQTANCLIRSSVINTLRRFPEVRSALDEINWVGTGPK